MFDICLLILAIQRMVQIHAESKVADVVLYLDRELVNYEFVQELQQFVHEQAINGRAFLCLTDDKLRQAGMNALGKREELLALVQRTL
jgi:hypothetical protein